MITGILVAHKVRAMRRLVGLALLVLAGCPADDQSQPDAPGSAGVAVAWITDPAMVPGRVEDGFDLTSVQFHLRNLRVVGDAGAGDARTTAPVAELGWNDKAQPAPIEFPDAPPGLYARMLFSIDRGSTPYAYELHGTAETLTGREPYAILDPDPIAVDLDYQIEAAAGRRTTRRSASRSARPSACTPAISRDAARPARVRRHRGRNARLIRASSCSSSSMICTIFCAST